jgi:hypothetical protein
MKSKRKNTIRICSSLESGLKQQWNQMIWPAKKLGCGIAAEGEGKDRHRYRCILLKNIPIGKLLFLKVLLVSITKI